MEKDSQINYQLKRTYKYLHMPVRVVSINNEPWWVLKDVCEILGIDNPSYVKARLDDDEVGSFDLPHPQSPSKLLSMVCVNEPGLYNVILRSDKEEAKTFRRWITHDVIPSIRKKGFYGQMSRFDAMEICRKKRVSADEYYQHVTGSPYKYLPIKAAKEKRYQNQIVKLQAVADSYKLISDLYEYTISDIAQKAELTNDEAWDVIRVMESRGYKFEYRELANKIRFTQDDKMKVYYFVNRERAEPHETVCVSPKTSKL